MSKEKVSSKLCMAKDVGRYGRLFGGNLMAWLDEAAAIYALKCTGEPDIVSYRYSEMIFKRPAVEGDIIDFYCRTLKKGTTSFCFELTAEVCGETVLQTECVFVAVDKNSRKKKIDWPE
jgi:acyl-CoA thioesterase YciA